MRVTECKSGEKLFEGAGRNPPVVFTLYVRDVGDGGRGLVGLPTPSEPSTSLFLSR